jgi:serine/threonine-protein kinase
MLRDAAQRLHAAGLGERSRAAQVEATLALVEMIGARNEEAERLARHALAVDRAGFGPDSMQAAMRLATLGKVLQETGRYDDALASYREALAIVVAKGGEDHARTTLLHTSIGDVLRVQRHYAEALPSYEAALRVARAQLPEGHRLIGGTLTRLGDLLRRMRRFEQAEAVMAEAIEILDDGPSGQYAQALQFHAALARATGRFDLAAERYNAAFEAFRAATGESVYTWLTALARVQVLVDAGRLGEADALLGDARAALARMPEDPYATVYEATVAGLVRHEQGRTAEAIESRRRGLQGLLQMYGAEHAETLESRVMLASSLIAAGGQAERTEALRLIEDAGSLLSTRDDADAVAMYGNALLERSRIRHAEGDAAAARSDLDAAIERLAQRPEDARRLGEARRFARVLRVDGD